MADEAVLLIHKTNNLSFVTAVNQIYLIQQKRQHGLKLLIIEM